MAGGSDIRAGKSFVELYVNKTQLVKDLKGVGKELEAWGKGISSAGKKLAAYGAAITAPMMLAVHSWASSNTELAHMSERLSMSVQALSALKYAAARNGVEFGSVEAAIHRTNRALGEAAKGGAEATMAFARIGLSTGTLLAMNPEQRFYAIADAINKIQNPALRDAAAMQLMGRGARELGPLLHDLNESRKEAEQYGLIVSPESVEMAKQLSRSWSLLTAVFNTAKGAIGTALAPMLVGMTRWIAQHVKLAVDWMKANRPLIVTLFQVGAALLGVGTALLVTGKAFSVIGGIIKSSTVALTLFAHGIGLITGLLSFALSPVGVLIAAVAGLAAYFLYASNTLSGAIDWLGQGFKQLLGDAHETFGAIADALSAGDIGAAAKVLWALLNLEWIKGINFIKDIWRKLSDWWQDDLGALPLTWQNMAVNIRIVWANLLNYLSKLWDKWKNSTIVEGLADLLTPIFAKLQGVSVEDARKALHEDFANARKSQPQRFDAMDAETAKQTESIRAGAGIDERRRAQRRAVERATGGLDSAVGDMQVVAARKQLEAAQKHAHDIGRKAREEMLGGKKPELGDVDMSAGQGGKITGTFSGAAAGMVAGSGGIQLVAKKMDRYIELGGKLVYLTEQMRNGLRVTS